MFLLILSAIGSIILGYFANQERKSEMYKREGNVLFIPLFWIVFVVFLFTATSIAVSFIG